jgi:hypothetical protein
VPRYETWYLRFLGRIIFRPLQFSLTLCMFQYGFICRFTCIATHISLYIYRGGNILIRCFTGKLYTFHFQCTSLSSLPFLEIIIWKLISEQKFQISKFDNKLWLPQTRKGQSMVSFQGLFCDTVSSSSGQSSWLHNGDVLCFLWCTNWIYICYVE